jgi:hypothetical protein
MPEISSMPPLEAAPPQNTEVQVAPVDARPKAKEFEGYRIGVDCDPLFAQLLDKHEGNIASAAQAFHKQMIREALNSLNVGHLSPDVLDDIRRKVDVLMNNAIAEKNEHTGGDNAAEERKKRAEALLNKWNKRK